MKGYEGYLGHELLHDLDDPGAPVRRRRVNGVNPSALVALANLQRRRRWDTAPRTPFADADQARRALAEEGVEIAAFTQGDLPSLARLAGPSAHVYRSTCRVPLII
jgi:hypothetical protein